MSKDAYIIDGTRSAIGNFKGSLAAVRTDDLIASVIKNHKEKNPELKWKADGDSPKTEFQTVRYMTLQAAGIFT